MRKHQEEVVYFPIVNKYELRDIDFISDVL